MKTIRLLVGMLTIVFSATMAMADITIGVNLSTTGPAASLGIPEKNALSFAPKTIAGQNVKFVVYDDASDTTNAVQNVKRLVSENQVDLILGPSTTPTSLAVIDVAAGAKTPMLAVASASAIVKPMDAKRKWIFKVTANDDIYATAMVDHMVKKGVKTVAVIAVDDPYGEANTKEYMTLAQKHGIKTLMVEKFKRTDTSATAQVLKIMGKKPDAVFIAAIGTPSAMPHLALVERGYKGKIYQSGAAANSEFLKVGGKAVEGAFMPASPVLVAEQLPKGYPTRDEALKFAKAYEGKFGPRSTFASHIWDAFRVLEVAIPKALKAGKPGTPQFREALRTAIENTKGIKGAGAVFNLSATDHSGVNQLGMSVIKIENGKWALEDHTKF
ncbi:ABC transporter substrate-binding protein [Geobacter sp. AOG1]|uniref:ABC transporter substrate-binding protein n=1 Tax=Geobacter sp. AOG1 TaxID=1566346 RepID=UPI001CC64449|nr:ABC transporter substrate-binding protein [Geobacter sp. AOG1]GFE57389.1 branched-chain amino acid ABC transporter substrate-binding protein [Geobacter sp. AOG1]